MNLITHEEIKETILKLVESLEKDVDIMGSEDLYNQSEKVALLIALKHYLDRYYF